MPLPDVSDLTDDELDEWVAAGQAEQRMRRLVAEAPDRAERVEADAARALDTIAQAWHAAHGGTGTQEEPVPYRPVTGAHDVWPADSWVIFDGAVWYNPHPANSWEPGAVGSPWVRQDDPDPDTGYIAWAVGQDVKVDDERTHDGRLWRAKQAHITHVGWEPSIYTHAVWTDLGPLEDA